MRGGGASDLALATDIAHNVGSDEEQIVRVHDTLQELDAVDERLVRVLEMRYGGLSEEEIAHTLGVTSRTVRRDWKKSAPAAAHRSR